MLTCRYRTSMNTSQQIFLLGDRSIRYENSECELSWYYPYWKCDGHIIYTDTWMMKNSYSELGMTSLCYRYRPSHRWLTMSGSIHRKEKLKMTRVRKIGSFLWICEDPQRSSPEILSPRECGEHETGRQGENHRRSPRSISRYSGSHDKLRPRISTESKEALLD